MAKVEILKSLILEIKKKFSRQEANEILDVMHELEDNPRKGKLLTSVGGFVIKEIKYKGFRFYFITDGHKLKFLGAKDLTDLLLRFVRMSDKKRQQETIDEIRNVLQKIGPGGFS
ncbi:hypothetical protein JW711_00290 [Candidatus Woesearchaeota archaeon]|nr:hypothetical protein [Candidatus Woesearchaeota archaeon]